MSWYFPWASSFLPLYSFLSATILVCFVYGTSDDCCICFCFCFCIHMHTETELSWTEQSLLIPPKEQRTMYLVSTTYKAALTGIELKPMEHTTFNIQHTAYCSCIWFWLRFWLGLGWVESVFCVYLNAGCWVWLETWGIFIYVLRFPYVQCTQMKQPH